MDRLEDKVAIITGGAGDIGVAMARAFTQEGAKVMLTDVDEEELHKAQAKLGDGDYVAIQAGDISEPDDVAAIVAATEEAFGGFDIVCANAGIEGDIKPMHELSVEEFEAVQKVNVRGVFLTLKHTIPKLAANGGGSVIITSSVAGLQGSPGLSAYCASKHAIVGLMKTAAQEYGSEGVRVNTINPGPVDGRMMRSIEDQMEPGQGDAVKDQYLEMIPLGRYAREDDVANLALFLASDESSFCNGFTYATDGGIMSG